MRVETWVNLGQQGQEEFSSRLSEFQAALAAHGVKNSEDFSKDWRIEEVDGEFTITDGNMQLISCADRNVVEALCEDARMNLGR